MASAESARPLELSALPQFGSGSLDLRLPGKLAGVYDRVYDLRRQQWRQVRHRPNPHANEKGVARLLLGGLAAGTLVLADLGYF